MPTLLMTPRDVGGVIRKYAEDMYIDSYGSERAAEFDYRFQAKLLELADAFDEWEATEED